MLFFRLSVFCLLVCEQGLGQFSPCISEKPNGNNLRSFETGVKIDGLQNTGN
jgi:hypothetical protein